MATLTVENRKVKVTNLDKIFWPELGLTKGDLIDYYIRIGPQLLPYIKNRPFSMKPFPDGVEGKSFYQKDCPKEAPDWITTTPIPSERKGVVNWCVINDIPSLIWIANRACIEMHTWFSRLPVLDKPDIAVLDIDPSGNTGFRESVQIAVLFKTLLDELGMTAVPKTSGATGMHIYLPIEPVYSFSEVRTFLLKLCQLVEQAAPHLSTLERNVKKRGDRVYLDAVQNASAKTIPAPYSLRPTPRATVSAPLLWEELSEPDLSPDNFTMQNIFARIDELGDLFETTLSQRQRLPNL